MRFRGDRGSALLLVPAALMVMFALTAIAIDQSHIVARKNELYGLATEASNDIVSASINQTNIRRDNPNWRESNSALVNKVARDTGEYALGKTLRYVFVGRDINGAYTNCMRAWFYQDIPYIYGKILPGRKTEFTGATAYACYFFD